MVVAVAVAAAVLVAAAVPGKVREIPKQPGTREHSTQIETKKAKRESKPQQNEINSQHSGQKNPENPKTNQKQ